MKNVCNKCFQNFEDCTCEKCNFCNKEYPLTELYVRNDRNICISCLNKLELED